MDPSTFIGVVQNARLQLIGWQPPRTISRNDAEILRAQFVNTLIGRARIYWVQIQAGRHKEGDMEKSVSLVANIGAQDIDARREGLREDIKAAWKAAWKDVETGNRGNVVSFNTASLKSNVIKNLEAFRNDWTAIEKSLDLDGERLGIKITKDMRKALRALHEAHSDILALDEKYAAPGKKYDLRADLKLAENEATDANLPAAVSREIERADEPQEVARPEGGREDEIYAELAKERLKGKPGTVPDLRERPSPKTR
jgi:hypothetical protein